MGVLVVDEVINNFQIVVITVSAVLLAQAILHHQAKGALTAQNCRTVRMHIAERAVFR